MEKAKQAAREFLSGDGKHKTTVDQDVRGAVTQEQVRPHQHENITTAIDKDVHQEHHQTRIQPVQHKEVLPEKHAHNILPVEHQTFEHASDRDTRATLEREAANYKDASVTHGTTHSQTASPTISGERIHHHVHEHIQPVIQKETVAPSVIHTTVPIHETHHAAPVHHESTTLPVKTLEEFTREGGRGVLEGRGTRTVHEYEGCPQPHEKTPDAQRRIHGENLGTAAGGENLVGSGGYGSEHHSTHGSGMKTAAGMGAATAAAGTAMHVSRSEPVPPLQTIALTTQ
ncbi:hypothetical protein B0I35DRAFT_276107 [Stachybotrys elegans]|uniref:Allergen n=1 Tax=Stachybotrys elegans TaxID=80388 RepID=A0A8K0SL54_9HYPO|nr:hypothetical protein B0I35DRAFT_276107 [Stachybotrys elegans]